MRSGQIAFVAATGTMTVAVPLLPSSTGPVLVLLVSACTLPPIVALVARLPRRDGVPWWMLLTAMGLLTLSNVLNVLDARSYRMGSEVLLAAGHVAMLSAAVCLVLRRGRNDVGGLLDVSVAAVGVGGLLWTALLLPRLHALHVNSRGQAAIVVSVLVLAGVLGAMGRLWFVAPRRLPALTLLCLAVLLALVDNVLSIMITGSMSAAGRPGWMQVFFLLAYICVGLCALDSSARELTVPGPRPADRLTTARLMFLGAVLVVSPVAGGVREMMGLPADGALLAFGCLLVVPLVLVRIGRLAAERSAAEAALHHQATHDVLTGLPNRAELRTRLSAAVQRERALGVPAVVLLFCDLDGFKPVNDRLGHLVGDQLLIEVGARIRAGLRAGDTVARYGGDEFVVLCSDDDQRAAADRLAGHVRDALTAPFALAGEEVRVGASVGVVLSDGAADAEDLIRLADQRMYDAKQASRSTTAA